MLMYALFRVQLRLPSAKSWLACSRRGPYALRRPDRFHPNLKKQKPMSSRLRCLSLVTVLALTAATLASAAEAIRIRAGTTAKHTDENGVVWLADQGFDGGDTIDRGDIKVGNTKTPSIYTAERYSMTSFKQTVPNGKYTVKLHFAETYEGIGGVGNRVFTFNVEGHEFKNFDVTAKAGGDMKAYVETVEVEVKDGKLDITFTAQVENPQINALEIIPAA